MSDNSKLPAPEEQQNTGFTPGEDITTRWANNFRLFSGQMTQEGKRQMKIARDDRKEEADCARCTRLQKAGFDQNYGIVLCANMVRDRGQLEDVLAHGMSLKIAGWR
ncbi:MAG: hypothetical protein LQ348_000706 [Seirophora lacunosa]|nr:MAG: hypothetical protein LQ348_000706 [Seirophora lacunosa]